MGSTPLSSQKITNRGSTCSNGRDRGARALLECRWLGTEDPEYQGIT